MRASTTTKTKEKPAEKGQDAVQKAISQRCAFFCCQGRGAGVGGAACALIAGRGLQRAEGVCGWSGGCCTLGLGNGNVGAIPNIWPTIKTRCYCPFCVAAWA